MFARNTHAVRRDKNQGGLHSTEQQKQSMETLRETSWKTQESSKCLTLSDTTVAGELFGEGEE